VIPVCRCGHPSGDHAKRVVPLSPHTPVPPAPPCLRDGCGCTGFQAPLLDVEEDEAVERMERGYEKGLDRPWGDA
jgi:hypothetical protein